ncbi:hypothetical protein J602_1351 [Acinetobacter baumannii 1417041]|nr:hypothetical protein J602_1351 [Acinetobacter baumannii 1417041]
MLSSQFLTHYLKNESIEGESCDKLSRKDNWMKILYAS